MATNRPRTRKKSDNDVIGGQWLPNLLTWGGVLLMITGGIVAYPTLQNYLAPPDAQSLEFSVTLAPPPTVAALQLPLPAEVQNQVATATAPPPVILPETEIITPENQGEPEVQVEAEATLEATAEAAPTPTPPPPPTPTPDPASLVPSRLVIPAINLDAPILEVGWETEEVDGQMVSSWIVPDSFVAGWHKTSALPGQIGNTVLNGHHNIHGEVFRDLLKLQPGDEIVVYAGGTVHYYSVTERHILEEKGQPVEVRMQNAQWITPTEDERLTLVTCWPYTNNTHRLVVVGLPMQPTPSPIPMEQ
jgi:LPXTG-site transpeptidase (sortase) family protein